MVEVGEIELAGEPQVVSGRIELRGSGGSGMTLHGGTEIEYENRAEN
jgi:hypothetical protein